MGRVPWPVLAPYNRLLACSAPDTRPFLQFHPFLLDRELRPSLGLLPFPSHITRQSVWLVCEVDPQQDAAVWINVGQAAFEFKFATEAVSHFGTEFGVK